MESAGKARIGGLRDGELLETDHQILHTQMDS
jgi:hypothetical protein